MGIVTVGASNFTGGTANDLDGYDGSSFAVGDAAMVHRPGYAPIFYEFISTTDAENSPYLIRPDTNGTGVSWRQCDLITGNCTLYTTSTGNDSTGNGTSSAPWATFSKIISWLADKRSAQGITITASVGAGTIVESGLVTIAGPIFKNVVVTGAGSSSTTLSWVAAGTGGIIVDNCTALQDLKNIKLLGDGASGYGITVDRNSSLKISADVVVSSFDRACVVFNSSELSATGATFSNSARDGVQVYKANAVVTGCTFNNNTNKGLYAVQSGYVVADSSTSTNNTDGYYASQNSFISASTCTTSGNTTDYSPAKTTAADPTFANFGSWIYG